MDKVGYDMEIFDNRKADDLKTWNELEQGQIFTDITETGYPTYYMKATGALFTRECYVDLENGIIFIYMGSGTDRQYKVLNAEMHIND